MTLRATILRSAWIGISLLLCTQANATDGRSVKVEGVLTIVLADDFENSRAETFHELLVPGEDLPFYLEFPERPSVDLRTGQRVRVLASQLPGRRLGVKELTVLEMGPGGGGGGGGGGGKKGGGGSLSVAVILINLLDADSLLTASEAEDMMWGPVDSAQDMFLQDSRGKIDFMPDSDGDGAADVYGPFNVAASGAGSCSYRSWSNAARALAEDAGLRLNNRDRYVYVLTGHTNNGCTFGGVAELNGDEAWINFAHVFVFVHELGHTLGMHHAGSDADNDGSINSAYGDGSCFMGASYRNIFLNAPHSEAMGYLGGSAIQNIPTTPGIYSYVLAPLAWDSGDSADPQILKIPRGDLDRTYYLSLRDDTAYDANLAASYKQGVSIHWYSGASGTVTGYVTTLADGESFVDPVNGITVTQIQRAADGSWVDFDVQVEATFDVKTPGFDVRSLNGDLFGNTVGPNDPSLYSLTLTNNDGPDTPPSTWTFSTRNIPAGMNATLSQTSATLSPGETVRVALTVEPNGAADGTYVFYVDATDDDGVSPHHFAVDDFGRMTIDSVSSSPEPPTGLTGSSYTSKGKLYLSLSWDASPSADVELYRVFFNEDPIPRYFRSSFGASFLTRWLQEPGTYSFVVAAESSSGKLSEMSVPVTVTIQK